MNKKVDLTRLKKLPTVRVGHIFYSDWNARLKTHAGKSNPDSKLLKFMIRILHFHETIVKNFGIDSSKSPKNM